MAIDHEEHQGHEGDESAVTGLIRAKRNNDRLRPRRRSNLITFVFFVCLVFFVSNWDVRGCQQHDICPPFFFVSLVRFVVNGDVAAAPAPAARAPPLTSII